MVGCVDDGGCREVSVSVDGLVASTTEAVAMERKQGMACNVYKVAELRLVKFVNSTVKLVPIAQQPCKVYKQQLAQLSCMIKGTELLNHSRSELY